MGGGLVEGGLRSDRRVRYFLLWISYNADDRDREIPHET